MTVANVKMVTVTVKGTDDTKSRSTYIRMLRCKSNEDIKSNRKVTASIMG